MQQYRFPRRRMIGVVGATSFVGLAYAPGVETTGASTREDLSAAAIAQSLDGRAIRQSSIERSVGVPHPW
jgi:hypothetical protein